VDSGLRRNDRIDFELATVVDSGLRRNDRIDFEPATV